MFTLCHFLRPRNNLIEKLYPLFIRKYSSFYSKQYLPHLYLPSYSTTPNLWLKNLEYTILPLSKNTFNYTKRTVKTLGVDGLNKPESKTEYAESHFYQLPIKSDCANQPLPESNPKHINDILFFFSYINSYSEKGKSVAIEKIFSKIDKSNSGYISQSDFKEWFISLNEKGLKNEESLNTDHSSQENSEQTKINFSIKINSSQLILVFLQAAIPFISFGFMDNCLMILCGDMIDRYAGALLSLSTFAAAGLGNTVSCATGVLTGGFVERLINKLGLPEPVLTQEQIESKLIKNIRLLGSFIGVIIGCLLGITPLFFLSQHEEISQPFKTKA